MQYRWGNHHAFWSAAMQICARFYAKIYAKTRCAGDRRWLLVLPSWCFQHIMDEKVGVAVAAAFAGDRLSMISPSRRGHLLEDLAKRVLERQYPGSYFREPPASTCLNGQRRGKYQAEWDGTFLGRRVEIKTARLSYTPATDTWDLSFYGIKLAHDGRASQAFDDLYLLSFAPDGFHLLKHDLKLGLSTSGVRTVQHGHVVRLRGGCGQSWKESLRTLLANLAMAGCKLVETISKRDPLVRAMYRRLSMAHLPLGDRVYKDTPWHTMSPALRSQRVERVCLEFDQMLNPDSTFSSAAGELDTRGHRRGVNNAAVDWIRDRTRVEVKYAEIAFLCDKESLEVLVFQHQGPRVWWWAHRVL